MCELSSQKKEKFAPFVKLFLLLFVVDLLAIFLTFYWREGEKEGKRGKRKEKELDSEKIEDLNYLKIIFSYQPRKL